MSEQTTPTKQHPQCWCWSYGTKDQPQQQIQAAYGAFCRRFGRVPTAVQVHPAVLVDGLQAPVGMAVLVNDHMPERAFYFEVPQA